MDREAQMQRIEACRELYVKYGGRHHELIEKEMRDLGYSDFHRRIMYSRYERKHYRPGWIDRYGWQRLLAGGAARGNAGSIAGTAGGPACMDAASASRRAEDNHTTYNNSGHHAGGTGVAGEAACVPGDHSPDLTAAFDNFQRWLRERWPAMRWDWTYQVLMYKRLKRVVSGECKRLMIFMPPRHGKSELATVRFPAWMLKHDPSIKVIIGSYSQDLANTFSRKIRNALMEDAQQSTGVPESTRVPELQSTRVKSNSLNSGNSENSTNSTNSTNSPNSPNSSPFPFISSRPKNTEAHWETSMGGGLRAVGVGAGVTGFGANLIIVDDPVKSPAEAESETYREKLWNWFNDDLYTRLEPDGAIILIQTRWHEDDLAGRLLKEAQEEGGEQWTVISLPALAEQPAEEVRNADWCDELGRRPGEALCPERYDEESLQRTKRKIGSYSFSALYQQRPVPADGGLFKQRWFKFVDRLPPDAALRKRGYDLGITTNVTSDYTASAGVAFDRNGNMYIYDVFRSRIEFPDQRRHILGRIETEPNTEHGIELSANGNAIIQHLRSDQRTLGRALRGIKVEGDKVTRALPWIALAEEGRLFLVRGPWNRDFIDEACGFPSGTHDDQIDAVSIALSMHKKPRGGKLYFF